MPEMPVREPTMKSFLHIGHFWGGVVPQQCVHGHDDPWRAEATLGAVSLRDSLLQHICDRHQWQNVTEDTKKKSLQETTGDNPDC